MVVLAVDVCRDRSAHGDESRAGGDGHEVALRNEPSQECVEAGTGLGAHRRLRAREPGERRHVQDDPAGILRTVAVGAAEAAGEEPARRRRCLCRDSGHHVRLAGDRKRHGGRRARAAPSGEHGYPIPTAPRPKRTTHAAPKITRE